MFNFVPYGPMPLCQVHARSELGDQAVDNLIRLGIVKWRKSVPNQAETLSNNEGIRDNASEENSEWERISG